MDRLHPQKRNKVFPEELVHHMEMFVLKHIQNRFYFSKTKHFMYQGLISEHMQTPASKCAIPENI